MKNPSKPQNKADKAQSLLFLSALQELPNSGAVASKDGKRYLRSKP